MGRSRRWTGITRAYLGLIHSRIFARCAYPLCTQLDSLLGATLQRTQYSNTSKRILTDASIAPEDGSDDVKVVSGLDVLSNNNVRVFAWPIYDTQSDAQCHFPGQSYLLHLDRNCPRVFRLTFRMLITPHECQCGQCPLFACCPALCPALRRFEAPVCHVTPSVYFAPQKAASFV